MAYDLTVSINADASRVSSAILEQARKAEAAIKKVPLRIQTTSLAGGFKTLTADIDRFDKSVTRMAAVISTFGQAAAVVFGLQNAFAAMVKSAISVEKQLTDINAIFGVTESRLATFSDGLFRVAKDTITTFDEVAKAAGEFARQGLSVEETLKRTKDAMTLVKISGGDTESAVQSLTAAINTFNTELLDTTRIVNTVTNVDAKFAVSARDLTESIKRAGATAQDAKVGFNELIAATTALQQTTARGGSVIGNSLKSIFTRTIRSDTLDLLDELGVKTRSLEGEVRPALEILKELSGVFNTLSDSQKSQVKESVAGVYQINALSALLSDLSSKYSTYDKALSTANETTDSATARLKILSETTSATLNTTGANLLKFGSSFGKVTITDNINKLLTDVNKLFDFIDNKVEDGGLVDRIFQGSLKGLGDYIGSGGLLTLGRAGTNITRLALEGVKDQFKAATTLNRTSERRLQLEEQIKQVLLSQDPAVQQQINSARTLEQLYSRIFKILSSQAAVALKVQGIAGNAAAFADKIKFSPVTGARSIKTAASGHIPSLFAEKSAISGGVGGAPKNARPVVIPNFNIQKGRKETIVANSSEYIVPNFANSGASAIFNQDMVKKMGLPRGAKKIMAGGHIPNLNNSYIFDEVPDRNATSNGKSLHPLTRDSDERSRELKKLGIQALRPDNIIKEALASDRPLRIFDPTATLKEKLIEAGASQEVFSKLIITSPRTPLLNKFDETQQLPGLQESVNIKEILKKDKSKLRPIDKILKYGKEKFGDSFFFKPFVGAQSDSVFTPDQLGKQKRLPSSTGYGGFFLQKGIPNGSKSGEEFRVHASRVGGETRILGGVGSKQKKGSLDFFANTGISSLGEFLSKEIAKFQTKRIFDRLGPEYDQTIAGVDILGTGNRGIKKALQYVGERYNIKSLRDRFSGGGAIEYNFSQASVAGLQGGGSGGLTRTDVLKDAGKALQDSSQVNVNRFVKRGLNIANMSGTAQSKSFKAFYKDLNKLKGYDENAFFGIARQLNKSGLYGIDVGKAVSRQKLDQQSGDKYLESLGFASGHIPNFNFGKYDKVRTATDGLFSKFFPGAKIPELSVRSFDNDAKTKRLFKGSNPTDFGGYFNPPDNSISINSSLRNDEKASTYIHELAHASEQHIPKKYISSLLKAYKRDKSKNGKPVANLLFGPELSKLYKPSRMFSESLAESASSILGGGVSGQSEKAMNIAKRQSLMFRYIRRALSNKAGQNFSDGFIPNLANLRFNPRSRDDYKYSNSNRKLTTGDSGSYTKFAVGEDALHIDFIKSNKKGEAFKMFNYLKEYGIKTGKRNIDATEYISQLSKRDARKLLKTESVGDVFNKSFPQLRLGDQKGMNTSGYLTMGDMGDSIHFKSLDHLNKVVTNPKLQELFSTELKNKNLSIFNARTSFAKGHIPNLVKDPLSQSIQREAVALDKLGYSKSEIFDSLKVQSSPKLKNKGNPLGLAVFNTLQGQNNINKAMSDHSGENIMKAGMVPNFAANSNVLEAARVLANIQNTGLTGSFNAKSALSGFTRSGSNLSVKAYDKVAARTIKALNEEAKALESRIASVKEGSKQQEAYKKSLDLVSRAQKIILRETEKNAVSAAKAARNPNFQVAQNQLLDRATSRNAIASPAASASKTSFSDRLSDKAFKASFGIPIALQIASSVFSDGKDSGTTRAIDTLSPALSSAASALSFGGPLGVIGAAGFAGYGAIQAFKNSKETFKGQFGSQKRLEDASNAAQQNETSISSIAGGLINISEVRGKGKNNTQEVRAVLDQITSSISSIKDIDAATKISKIVSSFDSLEEKIEEIRKVELTLKKSDNLKANNAALDVFLDNVIKGEKKLNNYESQTDFANIIIGSLDLENLPKDVVKNLDSKKYEVKAGDVSSFLLSDLGLDKANLTGNNISVVADLVKQKIKNYLDVFKSVDTGLARIQEISTSTRKSGLDNLSSFVDSSLSQRSVRSQGNLSTLSSSISDSKLPDFLKTALQGQLESSRISDNLNQSKLESGKQTLDILKELTPNKTNRDSLDTAIAGLTKSLSSGDAAGTSEIIRQVSLAELGNKDSERSLNQIVANLEKQNSISAEELKLVRTQTSNALKNRLNEGFLGFSETIKDSESFKAFGQTFSDSSSATAQANKINREPNTGDIDKETRKRGAESNLRLKAAEAQLLQEELKNKFGTQNLEDNRLQSDALAIGGEEGLKEFKRVTDNILGKREERAKTLGAEGGFIDQAVRGRSALRAKDAISGFNPTEGFRAVFKDDIKNLNRALETGDVDTIRKFAENNKFDKNKLNTLPSSRGKAAFEEGQADLESLNKIFDFIAGDLLNEKNLVGARTSKANELAGNLGVDITQQLFTTMNSSLVEVVSIEKEVATNTERMASLLGSTIFNQASQKEAEAILTKQQKAGTLATETKSNLDSALTQNTTKFSEIQNLPGFNDLSQELKDKITIGINSGLNLDGIKRTLGTAERFKEVSIPVPFGAPTKVNNPIGSEASEFDKVLSKNLDKYSTLLNSPSFNIVALNEQNNLANQQYQDIIKSNPITLANQRTTLGNTFAKFTAGALATPSKNAAFVPNDPGIFASEISKPFQNLNSNSLESERQGAREGQTAIVDRFINSVLEKGLPGLSARDSGPLQAKAESLLTPLRSNVSEGGANITKAEFENFAQEFIKSVNDAISTNKGPVKPEEKAPEVENKAINDLAAVMKNGVEVTKRNIIEVKVDIAGSNDVSEELLASVKSSIQSEIVAFQTKNAIAFGGKPGIALG